MSRIAPDREEVDDVNPSPSFTRLAMPFLVVSGMLVALSLLILYGAYRTQLAQPGTAPIAVLRWFDLSSERNVPTAWSALMLLGSAVAAARLAVSARERGGVDSGWLLLAATAAFLSVDESLELHERLGGVGAAVADDRLHFAWVVPGAALAAGLGLLLLLRLRTQPAIVRRRLVLAGGVYLTGALALEAVSGQVLRQYGAGGRAYVAVTSAEEALEMAGASLLLATLLCQLISLRRLPVKGRRTETEQASR